MAIEIFDKGICLAAFFVRWDPLAGDDGELYLSGQGVSGITALANGECLIELTEPMPPVISGLNPTTDTVYLQIVDGVMNKNAPVAASPSLVVWTQVDETTLRASGFAGEDMEPSYQDFWAFVFRVPCPPVATAVIPP